MTQIRNPPTGLAASFISPNYADSSYYTYFCRDTDAKLHSLFKGDSLSMEFVYAMKKQL